MMEAVRTSKTSVDNHFTRQYIPEDNSEHKTHHVNGFKARNCRRQQLEMQHVSETYRILLKCLNLYLCSPRYLRAVFVKLWSAEFSEEKAFRTSYQTLNE
jgi:hypothetical protein